MTILVTKDSKGKIRMVRIWYEWSDIEHGYVIHRITCQLGGKETIQPDIWIYKGKAKRTVTEQCVLEFKSHIKKYLDKGYKELPPEIKTDDVSAINEFLGDDKTDQSGVLKPMLAKQSDKVANKTFDRLWYASRKIDGVRALFYYKDGKILTASRGGGDYNYSTTHITKHPKMIKLFEDNPELILDGELYRFGKSLQEISGAARLEKNAVDCEWLEYYIYDVVNTSKTFEDRLEILSYIEDTLEISFDPERSWNTGELQVQIVPHEEVEGWLEIKSLHDRYVKEGWEGVVIRDPKRPYKPGGRSNDMLKVKDYTDSEFKVIGYELGLRGTEDMVFICVTEYGNEFKAKPCGNRELKEWYVDNFDTACLNKMAKVKFFYYSNGNDEVTGVPLQPTLIAFRDKSDL